MTVFSSREAGDLCKHSSVKIYSAAAVQAKETLGFILVDESRRLGRDLCNCQQHVQKGTGWDFVSNVARVCALSIKGTSVGQVRRMISTPTTTRSTFLVL